MNDLKNVFRMDGKNYYELDNYGKFILDRMFELLKDDLQELRQHKDILFCVWTEIPGIRYRFDIEVPDHLISKVIEAFTNSKNAS